MTITIAATSRESIPDRRFNNLPAQRRALCLVLVSGDCVWGFNSDVDDASGASATTTGIPLTEGVPIFLTSHLHDYSGPVYLYSTAGAVVRYQELNLPN